MASIHHLTGRPPKAALHKERLLFVAEEGPNSRDLIRLLERRGYDVFHALDAEQALEALQVQRFGVVLCGPRTSPDSLREALRSTDSGWLVRLQDSPGEPSLQRLGNGGRAEAAIAGLQHLDRVVDLLDRLLLHPPEPAPAAGGASAESLPIFDRELFARQMNHDPAMMAEIIRLYVEETGPQLRELEEMVTSRQQAAGRRLAHTLKGSFGAVFARRAGALARSIEAAVAAGDFALASSLVMQLKRSAAEAEAALTHLLD